MPPRQGGASLDISLDISLVSLLAVGGPDTEIAVPATVEIASGATVGTFSVDAVADGRYDGDVETRIFVAGEGFNKDFIPITTTNVDAPPNVVLNEFLADVPGSVPEDLFGDANGDGIRNVREDEFIEIVNISGDGTAVDLSGWVVSDASFPRHIFPPGTVLEDGRSIVVFGGGTPTGNFGGAIVQTASQRSLGLSNSGDTISVRAGGASVIAVTYTIELGNADQSAVLEPELTGDYILHSVATGSGGALFSPGTHTDGTPFAGNEPFVDIDLDGLLDEWEITHFGNLDQTATNDFDNDGFSNLLEFLYGTGPNDDSSFPLLILNIHEAVDAVELEWSTVSGVLYQIQESTDLETWMDLGDPISGDGATMSAFVSIIGESKNFFRIVVVE